ncbi:asparaginase [Mycobacterium sp. MYCO198283]|uniref:asparaginase n=1 Tax=Mycobacterium sp. MYCO198283 TaxID=2883505 RepID=UPI001E553C29|nr:asparaginase [Mycobacterium sp. MYCO198283]MCG5433535.1 asparaginase [Mycobacterium sp. MYCO198283]
MSSDDRSGTVVITTGGTIASAADAAGVLRPALRGADLLHGGGRVVDLPAKDSSQLTPADWDAITAAVRAATAGATGVVVTHGTDTLEETALWLELAHRGAAPVVLTGAFRSADAPDADGPANLRDAQRVAADPRAAGLGVLVCLGGRVLAPLGLHKVGGATGFAGDDVGGVTGGRFVPTAGKRRPSLPVATAAAVRVDTVVVYPGADGTGIDAYVAAGARGLVLEAVGSGNAGDAVIAAVARHCAAGVAIVVSTRVPQARVAPAYGPGRALVDAGAVVAARLRPPQARVLLMAALSAGSAVDDVFDRWG